MQRAPAATDQPTPPPPKDPERGTTKARARKRKALATSRQATIQIKARPPAPNGCGGRASKAATLSEGGQAMGGAPSHHPVFCRPAATPETVHRMR